MLASCVRVGFDPVPAEGPAELRPQSGGRDVLRLQHPFLWGQRLLRRVAGHLAAAAYLVAVDRGAVLHCLSAAAEPRHRLRPAGSGSGSIAALFLLSLAASIGVTPINPDAAFYLAPMRVWELMLGALLAAGCCRGIEASSRCAKCWPGRPRPDRLCRVPLLPATPFPGWHALIPCLGAALLIYAGEDERTRRSPPRLLSLWPLVFVGLISYSLYLWHWPLLVFARYWTITPLTGWQSAAIVIASFILAALSWRYVEQPFRGKRPAIPRRILLASAATAMSVAVAFGLATASTGWPARFSPQVLAIDDDSIMSARQETKLRALPRAAPREPRACSALRSRPTTQFGAIVTPLRCFQPLARSPSVEGIALEVFVQHGCPPVVDIDFRNVRKLPDCRARNSRNLAALESAHDIGTVILISRYALYIKDGKRGLERSIMFGPNGEKLDERLAPLFGNANSTSRSTASSPPARRWSSSIPYRRSAITCLRRSAEPCDGARSRKPQSAPHDVPGTPRHHPFHSRQGRELARGSCGSIRTRSCATKIAVWSTQTARRFTRTTII